MNDRHEFALAGVGVTSSTSASELKCNLIRRTGTTTTAIKRSRLLPTTATTVIYNEYCQVNTTQILPMTMTTASSPSSSSAHSQLHPIHHHRRQRPRPRLQSQQQCHQQCLTKSAKAFRKEAVEQHENQTNNRSGSRRQSCLLPLTFRSPLLFFFLLLSLPLSPSLLSLQAAEFVESSNHHHQHHSKSHQKHPHRQHSSSSSILSTLLTFNELITAESIFPCLDTFDVVLMRSTDGQLKPTQNKENPLAAKKQQQPEGKLGQRQQRSDNDIDEPNRTRQLIRVYSASKEVVEEIAAATEHHRSNDRLYPVKNHHHYYHKYRRRRPNHHHYPHPLRPSMLIELRQLQYVREYYLPVKSQLLRMRCDVFEPAESIYYCFIYVVLHRRAVHFESLPYCVPTTLSMTEEDKKENEDYGDQIKKKNVKIMMRRPGVNNRISSGSSRQRRPLYPFLIDPPPPTTQPSENDAQQEKQLITFGRTDLIANDSSSSNPTQKWYLNDDHLTSDSHHHQQQHYSLQTDNSISRDSENFNGGQQSKASTVADEAAAEDDSLDPLQQIRSLIPPPGPAAFGRARTRKAEEDEDEKEDEMNSLPMDNAVDYDSDTQRPLGQQSTEEEKVDSNIMQFALKSSDSLSSSSLGSSAPALQSDYHRQHSPVSVGQRIEGNEGSSITRSSNTNRRDKVARKKTATALSVQRRSCYCSNSAIDSRSPRPENTSTSILRLNLTASETTVLHLVITSCPAAEKEEEEDEGERGEEMPSRIENGENKSVAADDETVLVDSSGENAAGVANYVPGGSFLENQHHLKEAAEVINSNSKTKTTVDKEQITKPNGNKTKKARKGKGKKEKKTKNHHQPTEPVNSTTTTSSTTTTTTSTTTTSTTTEVSASFSTPPLTVPTVCILSIENPLQYSFKLDSIEPSLDWPAGIFDGHSMQGGGLDLQNEAPLDLLEWLRRFPFLVVRSGQRSIDPQMNIENRSATHYLRASGHLRFEALSSLNVTLRFRRSSPPTSNFRDSMQTSAAAAATAASSSVEGLEVQDSFSSWLNSVRSSIDSSISYFVYRLAAKTDGPNTPEDSTVAQLTAFHLTSMLLSLFILVTLAIFAVIAYLQASREDQTSSSRRVQIRTPAEEEEEFDMDSSPRHHHPFQQQQQSSTSSENHHHQRMQLYSNSQQASKMGGHFEQQHTTKSPSFTLEQQSLEMDYYDYAAPLTIIEHHQLQHTTTSPTCHFRTLPIKVNSPNKNGSINKLALVKQNNSTITTSSCCSLAAAAASTVNGSATELLRGGEGGQSTTTAVVSSSYVINDHQHQPNSNSEAERMVATLARLSFTEPPVLLSTFRPPSTVTGEP